MSSRWFLIILILIVVLILAWILRRTMSPKFRMYGLVPLMQLRTGDLVFFTHERSRYLNTLENINFTHSALAIWIKGELYFLELTSTRDIPEANDRPSLQPARQRFESYAGYACGRHLHNPVTTDEILTAVANVSDVTFNYNFLSDWILGRVRPPNPRAWCCSEYIYEIYAIWVVPKTVISTRACIICRTIGG